MASLLCRAATFCSNRQVAALTQMSLSGRSFSSGGPGSGAGKGGGGGGSIREAGGKFGEMEAAREDEYFYKLQKEQLKGLKKNLESEIEFHERHVKHHLEAIERHKKRREELHREEQTLTK